MPAGSTLFAETWPGANGTAWPNATSTNTSSAATAINTDTGHGQVKTTGTALANYLDYGVALYDTGTNRNVEIACEFQWNATTEQYIDIGFRRGTTPSSGDGAAPSDGYTLEMQPAVANGWWLNKWVGGAVTTPATGTALNMAAATTYALRIRCIGQTIRIKVWAGTLSTGEPSTWGIDFVDDNYPEVIATAHYASVGTLGGSTAGPNMYYDNLTIATFNEPVLSLLGSTTSVSAATSTAVALTGNALPQVGDTILVCGSRDNITNDPATGDTATDSAGNTYSRLAALASPAATSTAAAGQVGVMLASTLTTAWTSSLKTVTWAHPSTTSRAMTVLWIGATGGYRATSVGSGGGTAGTASATTGAGTPATDDLVVGMTAFENSGTQTETIDTDTTNGAWSSPQTRAFSGSSATANTALTFSKVITQNKRLTAGGAQTYNTTNSVTLNVDTVSLVAAFTLVPTITQAAYRFYADGTETGSTALAAQDTAAPMTTGADLNVGLRVRLQSTNAVAPGATDDWKLQWEKNASGTWADVAADRLTDGYSETNVDSYDNNTTGGTRTGQSFMGDGNKLARLGLWVKRTGTNAVTWTAELYAHTGTYGTNGVGTGSPLATTTAPRAVSSFQTTAQWEYWSFDGTFTLAAGTPYVIAITPSATDATNYGSSGYDSSSSTHPGMGQAYFSSAWQLTSPADKIFQIRTAITSPTVVPYDSTNLTDGAATTNRLGAGTGTFVAGEVSEDGLADDLTWTANNYTEAVYSLTVRNADVAAGDTLRFRVLRNGTTAGLTYTVTPTITVTAGSTAVNTSARMIAAGHMVTADLKLATSSARTLTGALPRATAAKVATGAAGRLVAAPLARATAAKVATSSGLTIAAPTPRTSVAKLAASSGRLLAASTGTVATQHVTAARLLAAAYTYSDERKVAASSARLIAAATGATATQHVTSARLLAGALMRASDAKVASSSARLLAAVLELASTQRNTSARLSAAPTMRATAAKVATSSARTLAAATGTVASQHWTSACLVAAATSRATTAKVATTGGTLTGAPLVVTGDLKVAASSGRLLAAGLLSTSPGQGRSTTARMFAAAGLRAADVKIGGTAANLTAAPTGRATAAKLAASSGRLLAAPMVATGDVKVVATSGRLVAAVLTSHTLSPIVRTSSGRLLGVATLRTSTTSIVVARETSAVMMAAPGLRATGAGIRPTSARLTTAPTLRAMPRKVATSSSRLLAAPMLGSPLVIPIRSSSGRLLAVVILTAYVPHAGDVALGGTVHDVWANDVVGNVRTGAMVAVASSASVDGMAHGDDTEALTPGDEVTP